MKKKKTPLVIALAAVILLAAGALGVWLAIKYMPSFETADLTQRYGVTEDEVAVLLNDELQDDKGIFKNNQTYLPLTWINGKINEKFFWDENEKLLIYTLPEEIVYATDQTKGSNGSPLLILEEDEVYLALGLITGYTNIRIRAFDAETEIRRIYIDTRWDSEDMALLKRKGKVREKGGIKSPIVAEAQKGSQVRVIEAMDEWSEVMTEDGYIGYIQNRFLAADDSFQPKSTFIEPEYTNITMDEKVCLLWHQVLSNDANSTLEARIANTKGVNVVAPTWFAMMDNEGNYQSFASKDYVDKAHELGLQVWAVLDNFNYNGGKDVNTQVLMGKTSTRKKLIAKLMEDADTYGFDGINLDFETLREEAGPYYVQFIRELSVSCRKKKLVLSVDNYVPASYNLFYNRAEQGRVADYVIVMGYDEHFSGGEMGSVASINFVKNGIVDTLKEVPKEKVVNAIPFFTRVWTEGDNGTSSSALGIEGAQKWVEENNVELIWQEELGQYYGELFTDEGKKYIWMEEKNSIQLKMNLIEEYGLAGVACWKAGFEPKDIWDVVNLNE